MRVLLLLARSILSKNSVFPGVPVVPDVPVVPFRVPRFRRCHRLGTAPGSNYFLNYSINSPKQRYIDDLRKYKDLGLEYCGKTKF